MSDNPLDPQFWSAEEAAFWELLSPLVLQIYLRGVTGGAVALPADAAVLMNWNALNQAAIDFLRRYKLQWVRGIADTTRDQLVTVIEDWIRAGEPLPVLQDRLAVLAEVGNRRAEQIAITEVTRAYAEGNIAAWRSTGFVGGKRWMTANDDRVCPICAPLNGMVVELNSNGFTTEVGGLGITAPPAHVRCRCWLQPVVSIDALGDEIERILNE